MAKVLIIEDDSTLLEMYSLKFQEDGFTLLTAPDGEAGLALALEKTPDIILLDVMMPKMDGFAVLVELRKNDATKKTPVLLLSNLGQKNDVDKGKELGATDYIVKASMTPSQVVAKVKECLKK
jgi:DNA-binding response OmpR family regulator